MKYNLLIFALFLAASQSAVAQTIVPTQTDEIIIDNGTSGKADPNDRIRYRVTIQNTGGATGNNVQLNAVPDPKTTLVPGSFRSSPLAVPDVYTCTGNVSINVPATSGVKVNDFDDNLSGTTLSCGACTSANGGTVVLNNDGSFTYNPPAGFTGSDNFTYTITDGNPVGAPVPATDNTTVTITVSNLIWFIDNSAAAGDGRRNTPFNSLAAFNAGSAAAGDVVYIEHTGTNYTGGIVLQNSERLFGEGHTGALNLANVLPFTLAPNSIALPTINGSRPVITNAAGDGITLASGNTIRGLNIGNCSDFGIDNNTLAVGNLSVSELNINSTGGGFRANNGGTLTVTLGTVVTTGGTNGIHLDGCGGTFTVTGATNITNTTGIGLHLANAVSGSVHTFSTITLGNTGSHSIEFGSNAGTVVVTGLTTINSQAAGANMGLHITGTGATGAITMGDIDINGRRDRAIRISSTNCNITTGAVSIDNPNLASAVAIVINAPTTGNINFGDTDIDNSNGTFSMIEVQAATANVSFGPGSSLSNSNDVDIFVNAGSGNVTFDGTINSLAQRAVWIQGHTGGNISFLGNITSSGGMTAIECNNNTGGTITFSGTNKTLSGSASVVKLNNNTGTTINFTNGGLAITAPTGTGFEATGGGTISVQGSNNTINASAGTALNIDNTTIGSGNVTFRSISANGAANGIVLNTTGSSGGLLVTGTGTTDGSGGTIQNITNRGVSATNTSNLSLKNMTFTNANTTDAAGCNASNNTTCNAAVYMNTVTNAAMDNVDINGAAQQGINLREVNGFQFLNSTVINGGAGGQTEEADLYAQNIFGSITITNSSLTVPAERAAVIYNTGKTMTLTVSGSTFGLNQSQPLGADGLEMNFFGACNSTINISGCTFTQPKTNGLQVITDGTSYSNVNVSTSTFDSGAGLAAAIDLATNGSGDMDFNIVNNPLIKSRGINAVNIFGFSGSKFEGRVNNNTITVASGSGAGVRVNAQGNLNSFIEIKNNTINGSDDYGITCVASLGSGRLDVTATNNVISLSNLGFYGIHTAAGISGSMFTNKICANVAGNNTNGVPVPNAIGNWQARAATGTHEILLQGTGGSTAVIWNNNSNTPINPPAVISQAGSGMFTFGATCTIPANPN